MKKINLDQLDLMEFTGKDDCHQHCKATFPLIGLHGSLQLASVYFEIAPGDNLGRHTDSAEELLVILDGELTVSVGSESAIVKKGYVVLVPKMVPHDLLNSGGKPAKVLGVFGGANNIVATFEKEWLPTHSRVVDTALFQ
jgi:quercetin dioxygenase-like cupin family protein